MRKLIIILLTLFLSACLSLIYVAKMPELEDGSHSVRLNGNGFSTESDMQNKLNAYASKVCGGENYQIIKNFASKSPSYYSADTGAIYTLNKPQLEAEFKCDK